MCNSQLDVCEFIAKNPESSAESDLPFSTCPAPQGYYEFSIKININEFWLGIDGNQTVKLVLYKITYHVLWI